MITDSNILLIFLSALVIFSYVIDALTRKIRFPAVIILIFTGIALRFFGDIAGVPVADLHLTLPILGTVGLIVIVFEGALEIRFGEKGDKALGIAALSGFVILLISAFVIGYIIHYFTQLPYYNCLVNAIPLSVVSSAVAISSAKHISPKARKFITYESTFSDIFGILLFNFTLNNETVNGYSFGALGMELILLIMVSVLFSFFVLFLLNKIKGHSKYFFIIAVLLLTYALAKSFHLSALFIVLVLGLFLNNADLIPSKKIKKYFVLKDIRDEMHSLYKFSSELAFLLKTFFFIIFGYTIMIQNLGESDVLVYGSLILGVSIIIRLMILIFLPGVHWKPELFFMPRGLISILLMLSIPEAIQIPVVVNGIGLFVILGSGIFMAAGMMITGKGKSE